MDSLLSRIAEALENQDWAQAQALIGATTGMELRQEDAAWLTLYRAELAWGKGNSVLVQQHLHRLSSQIGLPAGLEERLATCLASWYGFKLDLEDSSIEKMGSDEAELLLWWAKYHHSPGLQARALRGLGDTARKQTRYDDAVECYEEAVGLYREIEDWRGAAQALWGLGEVAGMQARFGDARDRFEEALRLSQESEDRRGQANALLGLGTVARMQGHYGVAVKYYEETLRLSGQIEDGRGQAHALRGLGAVAAMQDRYDDARGYYEKALGLSQEIEDRWGQAIALRSLGHVAGMQARYGDAGRRYEEALKLSREVEDRRGQAYALEGLGEVAAMQDRYGDARQFLDEAFGLMGRIDMHVDGLSLAIGLANQTLERAEEHLRLDRSRRVFQQAVALAHWLHGWAGRLMAEAHNQEAARGHLPALQVLTARLQDYSIPAERD